MTDPEGVFTFVNAEFQRLYGYAPDEVVGRATPRLLKGGAVPRQDYGEIWGRLVQGHPIKALFVNRTKAGRLVDVEAALSPIWDEAHRMVGFLAIERDVSERRRMDQALRQERDRAQQYLDTADVMLVALDLQARITMINRKGSSLLGWTEDLIGRNWIETCVPERLRNAVTERLRVFHTGDVSPGESVVLTRTGEERLILWRNMLVRDGNDRIVGTLSSGEDVTERRLVEQQLRESQIQLQLISDNMLDLVSQVRLDGTFVYASPSFRIVLGHDPRDLVGTSAFSLVHPEDLEHVIGVLAETVERRSVGRAEFRIRHADGTYIWLETVGRLLFDTRQMPSAAILSGRDTTARRQLEDRLRQAQKLEAVGSLAGGIAHDFNNLLTAIMGYADLATAALEPDSPIRADLEEISRAGRSAEALTRQLLIFSRKSVPRLVPLNLNDIVLRLDNMLRRMVGEHIQFDIRLAPDLGVVVADAGQMEQVLMNLVVNARDAMPTGGLLTIETRRVTGSSAGLRDPSGGGSGLFNAIVVTDSGCGMTAEVRSRIFDPFFTTKGPEKGTGLGLATVDGIAQQAGGYVTVESAPGEGSTFVVALPASDQAEHEVTWLTEKADSLAGRETILFVEDSATIRAVASRALERYGYTVLTARSAADALEQLEGGVNPDLLITDVVLPEMDGRALAERVRATHVRMKVVFTSGFSDDSELLRGLRSGEMPFLQKPYTMDTLARTVRHALDGS